MRNVIGSVLLLAALALGADVGVDTILAPVGTIDSGQMVTPRCVVANYADSVSNVKAHFGVFDAGGVIYLDSLMIPGLAAGARDTVAFTGWIIELRDSLITKAWTTCAGDTNPANDTCRQKFFVRVGDVAIIQILMPPPDTTFDSGAVFYPSCRIWDFGNWCDTCIVGFRIGEFYSACTLHARPWPDPVIAPDSHVAMPGVWACSAKAGVRGDLHPENNVLVSTFRVGGVIGHDVGVVAILAPGGFVDTATTVIPSGRVKNFTSNPESFWTFFNVNTLGGAPVYAESVQVSVGGLDSLVVDFPSTRFPDVGLYVMACSTAMPGDQNSTNDVVSRVLRVVPYLQGDVGIVWTVMPHDTVDTLMTFSPTVRVKNYGVEPCSTYLHLLFADSAIDRTVYEESLLIGLAPGAESSGVFPSVRFTVLGEHTGWLWIAGGDTVAWRFFVAPLVGIEERGEPTAYSSQPTATVIRGVLVLPRDMTEIRSGISDRVPRPVLLDATGRKVMALHTGANEVSRLATGVYFVREEGRGAGDAGRMRKVVVTR